MTPHGTLSCREPHRKKGFDAYDQMVRYQVVPHRPPAARAGVDIGRPLRALCTFENTREPFSGPTDSHSAGNGSSCAWRLCLCSSSLIGAAIISYSAESSYHTRFTGMSGCLLTASISSMPFWSYELFSNKETVLFLEIRKLLAAHIEKGQKSRSRELICGCGLEAALCVFNNRFLS